jgi:LysR family transcriptional regulator, glycine cleavage system transcriptional activator
MSRSFPPFAAVRAFEAAARHLSFKQAADELCLSPSAISHQIRALEEYLDTALFERSGNQMKLTLTGQGYAGKLTGLLDAFDTTTRSACNEESRTFNILCTPGFAARWLVPRLDKISFGDRVRLKVSIGAPSTDFTTNDSDLVIQWSDDPTPGVKTEKLMVSKRYPVICPILKAKKNIRKPEDLSRVPLMHDETADSWKEWFTSVGVAPPPMPCGPVFPNCELATTAAEKGQGVALAYDMMVQDTLLSGRLVRLFQAVTLPKLIYSIAYPEANSKDPMIQAFRDWIFAEVQTQNSAQPELEAVG